MSRLEKFGLFTGIIGLIADSITLLGLVSGLVIPPPQLGFWSKPEIVAAWTLTLLVYSLIACLFFTIQYARNRWEHLGRTPGVDSRRNATLILGYLFWLPISIIWGVAVVQLFERTYNISIGDVNTSVLPVMGWLYFFLVVPIGGYALTQAAIYLNDFFNPVNEKE